MGELEHLDSLPLSEIDGLDTSVGNLRLVLNQMLHFLLRFSRFPSNLYWISVSHVCCTKSVSYSCRHIGDFVRLFKLMSGLTLEN